MFDLESFSLEDMYRCSASLRTVGEGAATADDAAQRIVSHLFECFRAPENGAPACLLVRLFRTVPTSSLSPRETAEVIAAVGPDEVPNMVLSLRASRGVQPSWNDPLRSRAHQLIPLASPRVLARMPMINGLITQLGLPPEIFSGSPFDVDDPRALFDVFHVEDARGSPLVPDQAEFVQPFGVRSALGFGGVFQPSQVFVVVLFSSVTVPRATAQLFRLVAPSVALALLASGRDICSLETRIEAYQRVLRHHEQIALSHQWRLVDLTQRLTRSLAERQKFEALVENSSDFIGIADADGRAVYLNPAGRGMAELDPSIDLSKTHIGDFYGGVAREHMERVVIPTTLREERWEGETSLRGWRTNASIPVSDHHFTIRDPETHSLLGIGTVSRDISDKRRADEERERLLANEREARAEAQAANRTKDDFLAFLGHELRNPLAPILTALELMRLRGHRSREQEVIGRQATHMARLVDDLLDVSRIARGKVQLHAALTEISWVVHRAVEMASPLLEQRKQRLSIEVPERGLSVYADAGRLAQVISNLLANASKYSGVGTEVQIAAERRDDLLLLRVRDQGIGIAADRLASIFDSFVQHRDAGQEAISGLGLGLSIVRSLVHLHGGSVRARSDGPGKGSEFVVELPLAASDAPARAFRPDELLATPQLAPEHRRRVLVVDDNQDAAEMLSAALSELGHEVKVANDGPSALKLAQQFQPQIALLDIGLPVMDGYELARRLLESRDRSVGLQLIAVTGYGQDSDRRRALDAGFTEHLVKPINLQSLADAFADDAHAIQRAT